MELTIGGKCIFPKEFAEQRVVTFADIDMVHQRASETASRNFRENRDKFIDVTVQQIDCYTSEEEALTRMRVASRIAFHLADEVAGLARMKRILIPMPY